MLVINGKKLDTANEQDPFVQLYKRQIKLLRDKKKRYWTFTFPTHFFRMNDDGQEEHPASKDVPFRQRYITKKDGTFDVIYYNTSFYDTNGREQYRPRRFDLRGPTIFDIEKDEEIIWWLIYVCPWSEKLVADHLLDLADHQNRLRYDKTFFVLQDKKKEAKDSYAQNKMISDAFRYIYDPIVGMKGDNLKTLALAMNVKNIDEMEDEELRENLGRKVMKVGKDGSYNMTAIKEFLDMVPARYGQNVEADTESMALLNDILQNDLVKQTTDEAGRAVWMDSKGKKIVTAKFNDDPNTVMLQVLKGDKEIATDFKAQLRAIRKAKKEAAKEEKTEN